MHQKSEMLREVNRRLDAVEGGLWYKFFGEKFSLSSLLSVIFAICIITALTYQVLSKLADPV